MNDLLQNLTNFNAKERFLLLSDVIGKSNLLPTNSYIEKLSKALGLHIKNVEFSALDYHLDWLYACLSKTENTTTPVKNSEKFIRGQHEDIDFIIGYTEGDTTHLILIEAKATTGWTNAQLQSKAQRLREIFGSDGKKWKNVIPHFVMTSPKLSHNIKHENWPVWMKPNNSIAWIKLEIPGNIQYVTRCDKNGKITSKGEYWKIKER